VTVSIIIPVLNDEQNLSHVLQVLQPFRESDHEIIVVDGGSTDNSLMFAQQAADVAIVSKPGRALQMNSGASVATGDVYLFLHADTNLPDDALQLLSALDDRQPLWGRFDVRLSSDRTIFRLIEWLMNLRSRLTSIATGDQAIFVDADLFDHVGGFPEIALMEDIAMSQLLKKHINPVCLKSKVTTSSRRWETNGIVSTVFLMWKLRLYYFFGVSPERLSQLYR